MRIILPKHFIDFSTMDEERAPVFFLAGPVLGGGDWQIDACRELQLYLERFWVVIPCRWKEGHPLYKYAVRGDETVFARQTLWERHYLRLAAGHGKNWRGEYENWKGGIIFWLPIQRALREDGSPYGRDTYGELGEWRAHMMHIPNLPVVVGAEDRYNGLSVVKANFEDALGPDFPVYSTLKDTVRAAARPRIASQKSPA